MATTNARKVDLLIVKQAEEEMDEKQRMRKQLEQNKDAMREQLKNMTAHELFALFDEDDSGLISFEEFRKMLPYLDIYISDAKALRYFRICDTDGSGEIDIDEFKVALFTCDPVSIIYSSDFKQILLLTTSLLT